MKRYIITIKVASKLDTKPDVRTICGDTVFVNLRAGQTATWTVKRAPKVKK